MAYVVCRRDGRFEIRESHSTANGPRARTLATFRVLDDDVLALAESRATSRFDRAAIITRAHDRGADYRPPDSAALARQLLVSLSGGQQLPDLVAQALRQQLGTPTGSVPDTIPPLLEWLAASSADRGDALRELLRMTDRLPLHRRRRRRQFPRLHSAPA